MSRVCFALLALATIASNHTQAQVIQTPVMHGPVMHDPGMHPQVGMPGIEYAGAIAAGEGGSLYPYDRQDPWLHGTYQRVPAYGGFASFRPYNYRHVFSQTQIATGWGAPNGMPYSQQFWNRYRGGYLQGQLHSQAFPQAGFVPATANGLHGSGFAAPVAAEAVTYNSAPTTQHAPHQHADSAGYGMYPVSATSVSASSASGTPISGTSDSPSAANSSARRLVPEERPIHVFPSGISNR